METASIIIANRNYERFLRQAIDSALAQTVMTEVVVVDDGSDDRSRDVIASYGDRIVAVFQDKSGQAAAINAGIAAASGSILFLLDSDDRADPERVATLKPLFEQNSDLMWLRHGLRAVDDANDVVVENLYGFGVHDDITSEILKEGKTAGSTSGLVLRRSFFDTLGPIPEHYTTYPDSYLLIRGALVGHGASVNKSLGAHHWHGGSFTAYHWSQFERASFHLALRKFLADDAKLIACQTRGFGPIAEGRTWWQMKANAEWQKSSNGRGSNGNLISLYGGFLRAVISSPLPVRMRYAQVLRATVLSVVPRRLFHRAWWITHVGRVSILKSDKRTRLRLS
jgi:glycosyltransferase involved in cell wall biosynthesis